MLKLYIFTTYNIYKGNNILSIVHDYTIDPNGFKDDSIVDPFDQDADYGYDDNGNMISDANKSITSIVYNHLNLPTQIIFNGIGNITYLYDATGKKLQKRVHANNGTTDVTTSYLDGFQYRNDIIQFFPTAEGYANRLNTKYDVEGYSQIPKGETDTFSYVYNYTDHLGNIRLSYTKEKSTDFLKIVEENHYYPFGLKHNNYNSSKMLYTKEGQNEKIKPLPPYMAMSYNYKFQGQERQDELGLNWDSFKYRNYDYAIGRFMSIDPLTEEYNTWSPYAFSGNRVIDAREVEGLEPHVLFGTLQEAAGNFGTQYNGYSINNQVEIGTQFYKQTDADGESCFGYTNPVQGVSFLMDTSQATGVPDNAVVAGDGHTHGNENDSSTIKIYDKVTNNTVENKSVNLSNISGFEIKSSSNTTNSNDVEKAQTRMNTNENFKSSYTFTPSGLVYSTQNINGTATPKVNVNLSRTNPSDPNSVMPMNKNPTSPSAPLPQVLPQQITIPIKN